MTPDDLKDIPDGALIAIRIEGRLDGPKGENSLDTYVVMLNDHIRLRYIGGETAALLRMATAIEVLPEPVVEPTGWGAVVEALYRDSLHDRRQVTAVRSSAGKRPWALIDSGVLVTWDQLIDPVVRSEGWKPDDYITRRAAENRADCRNCGMSDENCTKMVLKGERMRACCSVCAVTDTHPRKEVGSDA